MSETEIRLEGAPNFRDLGGYFTSDGRRVRHRRIFRSDGLSGLTERDFDTLASLGLRLVCDLRSENERRRRPTVWPRRFIPRTALMEVNADLRANQAGLIDILHRDPSERGAITMMTSVYRVVPDMLSKYVATLFDALATDEQLPLLFHCSAGKDRTGVLSAIILLALGVPRETVVEDYLKTERYQNKAKLRATLDEFLRPIYAPHNPPQEVAAVLIGVREAYLEESLAAICTDDGSIEGYLRGAGVTEQQLELLRSRLLE